MTFQVPEKYRVKEGRLGSASEIGNNGAFSIKIRNSQKVFVIASEGDGWEHVSISRTDRCPTWEEMCDIKNMFWGEEDCVVQFHPPKSEYVNNHPYCLHLWRHMETPMIMPDSELVGIK